MHSCAISKILPNVYDACVTNSVCLFSQRTQAHFLFCLEEELSLGTRLVPIRVSDIGGKAYLCVAPLCTSVVDPYPTVWSHPRHMLH